jgi:two-component system, NtrC family, nitrogen regulation response regulator NtrX
MCNNHKPVILILDDDPYILEELSQVITDEEWVPKTFSTGQSALDYFEEKKVACAIIDLGLPDMNGIEVLKRMKEARPLVPVLVLTGEGYLVDNAIEATRLGALNFLDKPVSNIPLTQHIHNALELSRLQLRNADLKSLSFESLGMIGRSEAMQKITYLVEHYMDLEHPVLLTGETGTGKSLLAEAIHSLSSRREKPFYTIDCSQLTEELFVTEVFGHQRGAFTGAQNKDKSGKVEMAAGGTLFMDEIQDLSLANQGRLRRFIETRRFSRLGETREREVDTRIILASNQDLEELVVQKKFQKDFYMRMNTFAIELPPLSERLEDIPRIADYMLKKECRVYGQPFNGFTQQAIYYLQSLNYPGNMRSLQGLIQRTVALAVYSLEKQQIDERDIHLAWSLQNTPTDGNGQLETDYNLRLEAYKHRLIVDALGKHEFNMTRAAEYLGLALDNLSKKIKRLGIDVPQLKRELLRKAISSD